jgi:hypothetical protein
MISLIFLIFVVSKNIEIPTLNLDKFKNVETTITYQKIPNLDTLVEYILTQSKTNMNDVNAITQVMLRRFQGSKYNTITEMLMSKTSLGSSTIKRGGGRYYFTDKSLKYRSKVRAEVMNVINKIRLVPCGKARYFSNHSCTYHSNNPKYKLVYQTTKHKFFVKVSQ